MDRLEEGRVQFITNQRKEMWCEGWPVNSRKEIFFNLINIFFFLKRSVCILIPLLMSPPKSVH